MGRREVTARGRTEPSTGAPRVASLTQSAIGLAVIALYALAGWDPMVRLFFWGGTTGAFGVLCLLVATSLAVLAFFARAPRDANAWHRLIAPALAALGPPRRLPGHRPGRRHPGVGPAAGARRPLSLARVRIRQIVTVTPAPASRARR